MVNQYGMFERDHRIDDGAVYTDGSARPEAEEMGLSCGGAGAPLRTTSAYTVRSAPVVVTGRREQGIAGLFEPK